MSLVDALVNLVGDRSERSREIARVCINMAKSDILSAHDWSFIRQAEEVQLQQGQQSFAFPQSARNIVRIYLPGKWQLMHVPPDMIEDVEAGGLPEAFSVIGRTVRVAPPPSSDMSLLVEFSADMSPDPFDEPSLAPLPNELATLLLDASYYRYMRQVAGLGEIAEVKQRFTGKLEEAIANDIARNAPTDVFVIDRGGGEEW